MIAVLCVAGVVALFAWIAEQLVSSPRPKLSKIVLPLRVQDDRRLLATTRTTKDDDENLRLLLLKTQH